MSRALCEPGYTVFSTGLTYFFFHFVLELVFNICLHGNSEILQICSLSNCRREFSYGYPSCLVLRADRISRFPFRHILLLVSSSFSLLHCFGY